ncbi:MAG: hypothetical protein FJ399_17265 [Verrucomicrobia bacterium]|nr:hypothetical protein [Verrucomicrobiota bacterium]
MPIARRLAAFLLVALWLPAMLHCRLEAAELIFDAKCCGAAERPPLPAADHGCTTDSCEVAEGEFTVPPALVLKAPSVDSGQVALIAASIWSPAAVAAPPVTGLVPASAAPPELARPWVLLAPGPLSPRAP